jgi:Uma2 family endonuclease
MVTIPYEYRRLPTAEDLPDSDETPVDNELQNDIPNILLNLLRSIWSDRQDWFWGVDMCFYYEPNIDEPEKSKAIVPDAFLALGVKKRPNERGRLSYVLWQEKVLPILALEVISKKYNGEYESKLLEYQDLGILYYVVYNALSGRRGRYKKHQSLEVYKLINGKYELIPSVSLLQEGSKVVWMPEIGLGIGCEHGFSINWEREWVYWYDRNNVRYPTAEERANKAEKLANEAEKLANEAEKLANEAEKLANEAENRASKAETRANEAEEIVDHERQQKEKLANYLRTLGINPDDI